MTLFSLTQFFKRNKSSDMNKFLIVGLGNIGIDYVMTRHNIGFEILDQISENYKIKTKLMSIIGKYSKLNAIISSSSSGLLPTRIYSKCKNPARAMIGHPFNPVYLLPAVEIVPGKKTSTKCLNQAKKFYKYK